MRTRRYSLALSNRVGAIRREIATAAGVLALILNLIGGYALSVRPVVALTADGTLIATVLCGTAPDEWGADPSGGPSQPAGAPHCVFCLPLMAGGLVPAENAPVLLRMAQPAPSAAGRMDGLHGCAQRGPPPARGPPPI